MAVERQFQSALYSGWVCDRLGRFCALALQELSQGLGLSNSSYPHTVFKVPSLHLSSVVEFEI